jgi:hypothetical protein
LIALHFLIVSEPRPHVVQNLSGAGILRLDDSIMYPLPFASRAHDSSTPQISEMPADFRLIRL